MHQFNHRENEWKTEKKNEKWKMKLMIDIIRIIFIWYFELANV